MCLLVKNIVWFIMCNTQYATAARLGNRTFPKNGKHRACKIPKIYGYVENMPKTLYVRYSAQSVHKTEYIGHRTYSKSPTTGKYQTNNIGR